MGFSYYQYISKVNNTHLVNKTKCSMALNSLSVTYLIPRRVAGTVTVMRSLLSVPLRSLTR